MRRMAKGASVSFIGEVGISGEEILVFDIDATPTGREAKFQVRSSASSSPTERCGTEKKASGAY